MTNLSQGPLTRDGVSPRAHCHWDKNCFRCPQPLLKCYGASTVTLQHRLQHPKAPRSPTIAMSHRLRLLSAAHLQKHPKYTQ